MIKLFMKGEKPDDEVGNKKKDPMAVMEKALGKACYNVLKVYD